jgi:hypothetical protein
MTARTGFAGKMNREQECWSRTVRTGQPRQETGAGHPELDCQDRRARADSWDRTVGEDSRDGKVRMGNRGQNDQNMTTRIGHLGQYHMNRTARTGQSRQVGLTCQPQWMSLDRIERNDQD